MALPSYRFRLCEVRADYRYRWIETSEADPATPPGTRHSAEPLADNVLSLVGYGRCGWGDIAVKKQNQPLERERLRRHIRQGEAILRQAGYVQRQSDGAWYHPAVKPHEFYILEPEREHDNDK